MRDEIGNELEPVRSAIEDVAIRKRDENPARELSEGGFGDVARNAAASGMAAGAPDAAVDLNRNVGSRPGKIGAVRLWPTSPEAFLLLVVGPGAPNRQDMLPLKRQLREGNKPLVCKGFFQMAGH